MLERMLCKNDDDDDDIREGISTTQNTKFLDIIYLLKENHLQEGDICVCMRAP